jgi:DNA invertase Pin-like site-specific DNA recombinase
MNVIRSIDSLIRVSRVNGRDLKSDRYQRDGNERAIEGHGYQLGRHIEALNVSGGLVATGSEWQAALERVQTGDSAGVAVAYIDRLSRDVANGLAWVDALAAAGGVLISGARVINIANPHERFTLIGELNNGELQLNIYKEKSRETLADVQRRGISNRLAYGYARNGTRDRKRDPKAFVINARQARVVKLVFDLRAAGERWSAIIRELHTRQVASPSGQPYWTANTLASVVKSRVYRGAIRLGGHVTKQAHQPIVTERQWKAAQSKATRVRTGKHQPGVAHGLLTCSGCGGPLSVQQGGHGHTFYGCRRQSSQGACPAPVNGSQAKLDEFVDLLVADALDGQHGLDVVAAKQDLTAAADAVDVAVYDRSQFLHGTRGMDGHAIASALESLNADLERAHHAYQDALTRAENATGLPASGGAYRRLPVNARRRVAGQLIHELILDPFPRGAMKRGADPADRVRRPIVWVA